MTTLKDISNNLVRRVMASEISEITQLIEDRIRSEVSRDPKYSKLETLASRLEPLQDAMDQKEAAFQKIDTEVERIGRKYRKKEDKMKALEPYGDSLTKAYKEYVEAKKAYEQTETEFQNLKNRFENQVNDLLKDDSFEQRVEEEQERRLRKERMYPPLQNRFPFADGWTAPDDV